jgi:anti-sigma-K factor RskA
MNYTDPQLRERLAGEYVLGTMPRGARLRFERLMRADATFAAEVATWEARLAPLDAVTPPLPPPARVWQNVERRIAAERPRGAPAQPWRAGLAFWRGFATVAAASCAALLLYILVAPAPPAPIVVAVLADKSGKPGWIAVSGPRRGEVSVSPVGNIGGDVEHSFELWGIAGAGPHPLGLLRPQPADALLVTAAELPPPGGALAVSREPSGGSPTGAPTGPVLYQGKVLTRP